MDRNACIRNTREEGVNPIVTDCNAPKSNKSIHVDLHGCWNRIAIALSLPRRPRDGG
jgi:hypothetical protein